jgi:hypothetical protein
MKSLNFNTFLKALLKLSATSALILIAGTTSLSAAPRCISLVNLINEQKSTDQLKAQDKALSKIDLEHFYQLAIRVLQQHVTVSSVRSTLAKERSRQLNLTHFLSQGKHNEAIDIYRQLFDNVELSYWLIKNTQAQLKTENLDATIKSKLEKRLFLHSRKFAQNYGEYIDVRTLLENPTAQANSTPLFIETAQKTINYLGVHKYSEAKADFASLKIPEERVTLRDIKTLYRSSSLFTRLKLLGDFKSEILTALRYMVSSEILVGTVDRVINKFPPATADKLKSMLGLVRSAHLRHRTLPLIIEIESLPHDAEMRLTELRKKNSITTHDELLVTYARTVEFSDSFNSIKAHAKIRAQEPENTIQKNFYERLVDAEARAAKLPDISLYEKTSNIDNLYTLIQTGIILKVTGPEVFSSFTDFLNFVLGKGLL